MFERFDLTKKTPDKVFLKDIEEMQKGAGNAPAGTPG